MNTEGKRIDWAEIKNRLKQGQLAQGLGVDRQKVEAIFRQRAERLATRKALPGAVSGGLSVLTFYLGQECYAIELAELAEVLPFAGCAPLPGAPPELLGVVNLRGEFRPVVDLAVLLGLPVTEADAGQVLLLRPLGAGLRVGRVDQVREISPEELILPGGESAALPTRYVQGLVPGALALLSAEMILSHPLLKETLG
ncbi:MAG: purine-binding chemotaxis protein CheW [Candidatus Latescibacteria bacterium]|nr:purine-binding chemotaxis protein CheW [Candidatus Latescibacterota bacterium]